MICRLQKGLNSAVMRLLFLLFSLVVLGACVSGRDNASLAWHEQGGPEVTVAPNEAALSAYQTEMARKPTDPTLFYGLASLFLALGRHADAVAALDEATLLDPDFEMAWYRKEIGRAHV